MTQVTIIHGLDDKQIFWFILKSAYIGIKKLRLKESKQIDAFFQGWEEGEI